MAQPTSYFRMGSKYWDSLQPKVLTTGCFDCLHAGHIYLFHQIHKKLNSYKNGISLIVGINSDESYYRYKGQYPLYTAQERKRTIKQFVDLVSRVVIFDEDNPSELIRRETPLWFVKGGDYQDKELPEDQIIQELGVHKLIISEELLVTPDKKVSTSDMKERTTKLYGYDGQS